MYIKTLKSILIVTTAILMFGAAGSTPASQAADQMAAAPGHWVRLIADEGIKFTNMGPGSLAVDNQERPHIAYGGSSLNYAHLKNGTWRLEVVDDSADVGEFTSIVVDAHGDPRISYYDRQAGDLKFATFNGPEDVWELETVDSSGDSGPYSALVLDLNGDPNIAYLDDETDDLRFAQWNSVDDEWDLQTIDSNGKVGFFVAMDISSSGVRHIVYYDDSNDQLKWARSANNIWSVNVIDSDPLVGTYADVFVDTSGNPHVSYYDAANDDLKYAQWNGGSWVIGVADNGGGQYTSIAVDDQFSPQISYRRGTALRIARKPLLSW